MKNFSDGQSRSCTPAVSGAALAAAASVLAGNRASADQLGDVFAKLPTQDPKVAEDIFSGLAGGGPEVVRQLLDLVGDEFGEESGAKPKYALHGLAIFVSRPGAGGERHKVAQTLAGELDSGRSDEAKALILRQLQLCGRPEEVPAIAKRLSSERLCEPAAQALVAIGGAGPLSALRAALSTAAGARKATIEQAVELLSRE